jgi:hypothetical protein
MMDGRSGARVLFFDLQAVESRSNVVQTVVEAEKHASNPVLPLGDAGEWDSLQVKPWASRSVIYDEEEELFKSWYTGIDIGATVHTTGYAISENGVDWTKPRLGLFEYNGNKDNNICIESGYGPVIKDPAEEDPSKRYKLILKQGATHPDKITMAYSADGLEWHDGPVMEEPQWNGRTPDIGGLIRDEQDPEPNRRYKYTWMSVHPANKPGPDIVRTQSLGCGPDAEHFTGIADNPILHPNDGLEQELHFIMLSPYGGQYVVLYEYGWYMPNGTGKFGSYTADVRLAASRDGDHYGRVNPSQPVIRRGGHGEWDDGFLVISDKPIVKDDKIYLYYSGNGAEWTSWPWQNKLDRDMDIRTGFIRTTRMGLATLRVDGFTCLETADRETPGSMETMSFQLDTAAIVLWVNVGTVLPRRSWIDVEVLDAGTNEIVPGFDREACKQLHTDAVRAPVIWGETRALPANRQLKLRFHLMGTARLYSFGFEEAQ